MSKKQQRNAILLGVGTDHEDGHKRITRSEDFCVAGGSEETHERMAETAIKTMEDLENRGRPLAEVDPRELAEILHKHSHGT